MSSESHPRSADGLDLDRGADEYVLGPSRWRKLPRLETKPVGGHRSGGYERFRSYEDLETQPGGKHDVYVYHHRLLALLHPDVVDEPIERATAHLSNREVHHCNGVKWDNRLDNFELKTKSEHAQITDQQRLAFAKDQQRRVEREAELAPTQERCAGCGSPTDRDDLATSPGFEGRRCVDCALEDADGAVIEL